MAEAFKRRLYRILEAGYSHDLASRVFDGAMAFLIITNVLAFSLETVPSYAERYGAAFRAFEVISVLIFTVEYALRIWVCVLHPPLAGQHPLRARAHFARTPLMVIDLIAIAPFYLALIAPLDLRVLRVLRLLRFLKLARFSPALNTTIRVIVGERGALLGVVIVMLGMLILAASLLYLAEGDAQPEAFGSVPQSMWWAVATLTTVGYGDVTPVTPLGRVLAGLVMIMGLGLFALPIGIIASAYMDEFRRRDFIVSLGLVVRSPVFANLTPAELTHILKVLRARAIRSGTVATDAGERPGALFVVASGEVRIRCGGRDIGIGEGGYWGGRSLLDGTHADQATAMTDCDLLVLEQEDFDLLRRSHPGVHSKIRDFVTAQDVDYGAPTSAV
ncbi:MAG: cyclic nucleotide-gated ion channel [Pseudomonadota bacterium]